MYKKILILSYLFLLTNCTAPSSALLGPIFTGAKTGSIYQASLSYSSNKIIKNLREFEKKKILDNTELKDFFISTLDGNLELTDAYEIAKVEFSNSVKIKPLR
tara:strand:+ start:756 stop:1064 length:309 start_codon:yes stop_codon:yes gene_type:complete